MSQINFRTVAPFWGKCLLLTFLICVSFSVYAQSGSKSNISTNFKGVVSNCYTKEDGTTYIPAHFHITWDAPELYGNDTFIYVFFVDNNNDGKLNEDSEFTLLTYKSDVGVLPIIILNPAASGDEKVLCMKTSLCNHTREITYDIPEEYKDKHIGLLIQSVKFSTYYYYEGVWLWKVESQYYRQSAILDYYPPSKQNITVTGNDPKKTVFFTDGRYYTNDATTTLSWPPFKTTGTGISSYNVLRDDVKLCDTTTCSMPIKTDREGVSNYTVIGQDYYGHQVSSDPITVVYDSKPPILQVRGDPGANWVHSVGSISATAQDSTSPVIVQRRLDNGKWEEASSIPSGLNDGSYNYGFRAVDAAGNESEPVSVNIKLDTKPPVIDSKPTLSFNNSSPIQQLNVLWPAGHDDQSGIDHYVVCYRMASIDGAYPDQFQSNDSTNLLSDTIPLTGISRAVANKIQVAIKAVDKSGLSNEVTPSITSEVILPALIEGAIASSSIVGDGSASEKNITTSIILNVTLAQALKSYDSITYVRESSSGRTPLPGDDLLPKSVTIKNADFSTMKVDVSTNHLVVTDEIPSSSTAGHKYIQYEFMSKAKGSSFVETNSKTHEYLLPNDPGTITWKIVDAHGNELRFDENGNEVYRSPDFAIYTDGKAFISFIGSDLDNDTWSIELDRSKKIKATPYDLVSKQRISGVKPTAYDTRNGHQQAIVYPVTLSYGTNTLLFAWSEGNLSPDGNLENVCSRPVNITLDAPAHGVYSVRVTDEHADYDSSGITVRPGEPLKIEIEAPSNTQNTYQWDFGDGRTANTQAVEHAYSQRTGAEQLTDSTAYTMTINVAEVSQPSTVTAIPLGVTVKDTQEGELYVPEIWRGPHTLTGVVVVPSGCSLRIGSPSLAVNTTVTATGGSGSGYGQGISVAGGGAIVVDNGDSTVTFGRATDQEQGWGTILLGRGATASITNAIIEYADRGLTVDSGATLTLSKSTLRNNGIGLHLFSGSNVSVDNTVISGNTTYGVKEEHEASPALRSNRIFKNFRDYYAWDLGPITIDDVNKRQNCGNNRGE